MFNQLQVSRFYDEYGEKEWHRLDADPRARVILHVHQAFLKRFVQRGDFVLDAGAGPGRLTLELARLGATVVAGDISPVQLELHRVNVNVPGNVGASLMTVSDLPFRDSVFDCVVCFGSVLSHLGDQASRGVAELVRVAKASGFVLISVMSRGNFYLPWLLEQAGKVGLPVVDEHVRTGLEIPDAAGILWRSYSVDEIRSIAESVQSRVIAVSASNVLATVESIPLLTEMEKDAEIWRTFLGWEEHLGEQPGMLERGSHIIAALQRTPST